MSNKFLLSSLCVSVFFFSSCNKELHTKLVEKESYDATYESLTSPNNTSAKYLFTQGYRFGTTPSDYLKPVVTLNKVEQNGAYSTQTDMLLMKNNYQIIHGGDLSWQQRHEIVKEEITKFAKQYPENKYTFRHEQGYATDMLDIFLLRETNTKEVQQATAFYLTLLLKHKNPNADVMTAALVKLKNYWSDRQISYAANQIIEFGTKHKDMNKMMISKIENRQKEYSLSKASLFWLDFYKKRDKNFDNAFKTLQILSIHTISY